ncbi:MAG: hypothetical protein NVSMB25_06220 [Thermoleophilaceae bacterium]
MALNALIVHMSRKRILHSAIGKSGVMAKQRTPLALLLTAVAVSAGATPAAACRAYLGPIPGSRPPAVSVAPGAKLPTPAARGRRAVGRTHGAVRGPRLGARRAL